MSEVVEQSGQLVANLIRTDQDIHDAVGLGAETEPQLKLGTVTLAYGTRQQ
jgi:hypothetical protein